MRKLLLLLLIGLLVFGISCDNPTESEQDLWESRIAWPSLCNSPWPIWGGDPQHTFRSPYSGPAKCDTTLIYRNTSGYFNTGPLIGPDDDIYIFSSFDETYLGTAGYKGAVVKRLTADGTVVWQTLVSTEKSTVFIEPVLTSQNSLIIACDDGTLAKVLADGTLEYRYSDQAGPGASWGLNLDKDGNIYYLPDNDRLSSFNPSGILRWQKINIGKICHDGPISADGRQTYTGLMDTLLALSNDGEIMWKYIGGYGCHPSVNNAGNILTFSYTDSSVICLSSNGKLKWKKQVVVNGILLYDIFNNISIGPKGEIIVFLYSLNDCYAVSLDRDGEINWFSSLTEVEPSKSTWTSCSIVDKDGNLYCSKKGTLFSLDNSGNIRWTIQMWDPSTGTFDDWLAINSQGELIYCVSRLNNNLVYKIY